MAGSIVGAGVTNVLAASESNHLSIRFAEGVIVSALSNFFGRVICRLFVGCIPDAGKWFANVPANYKLPLVVILDNIVGVWSAWKVTQQIPLSTQPLRVSVALCDCGITPIVSASIHVLMECFFEKCRNGSNRVIEGKT